MDKTMTYPYTPDTVSPPGETLADLLDERHMTQAELATRTGRPAKTISEIINGKAAITPETAIQFERVLGTPAAFWLAREQRYREFLARQHDAAQLATQASWANEFPLKAMVTQGWIVPAATPVARLTSVLAFFAIATPDQWEETHALYRKSPAFASNPRAVGAWLRRGEQLAEAIACVPYDASIFRRVLIEARALTHAPFAQVRAELPQRCASAGVALVIVPELPQTRLCGATRWLAPDKALIQLSIRYKTDDQFWFSFFHKAGHVLLHGKRAVFVDAQQGAVDPQEQEANRFAADMLIPAVQLQHFLQQQRRPLSNEAVTRFARALGIAPGIVVGRLQHDGHLLRTHLNGLKQTTEIA